MNGKLSRDQLTAMNASLAVAVVLLGVKVWAAGLTGSSAIYSDAAESVTHVLAVGFAAWALRLAHKPSDERHHFGHDKVAFLSSGFEGAMIAAAALLIGFDAVRTAWHGTVPERMGWGLGLTAGVATVNAVLGWVLVRVGTQRKSAVLRANGEHVLADVWTSVAVLLALLLVKWTGWRGWDPLMAGLAAIKLLVSGWKLMRESFGGLMDEADPEVEKRLKECLDVEVYERGLSYHNLRHRHSGRTHWVEVHVVFPDCVTVVDAHEAATEVEGRIADLLGGECRVITHLEPQSAEHREEEWEVR